MGTVSTKERYVRAAQTGMLTLCDMQLDSWPALVHKLKKTVGVRTVSLSGNRLKRAMPASFAALGFWKSLLSVDLSGNGLRCACALGGTIATAVFTKTSTEPSSRRALSVIPSNCVDALPLQTLDISGNSLEKLPPHLCWRFTRLKRLICKGNSKPLHLPGGLVECIGNSSTLESVDLCSNHLRFFSLVDTPVTAPVSLLPSLKELLLDANMMSGCFSLSPGTAAGVCSYPELRRVSLVGQVGGHMDAIDPNTFSDAPVLKSLDLKGNSNEVALKEKLAASPAYLRWREGHAAVISKKLAGGAAADLI